MRENRDFATNFIAKLMGGYPALFVHTFEYDRCIDSIERILKANGFGFVYGWNAADGFYPMCEAEEGCGDFKGNLSEGIREMLKIRDRRAIYVMRDLDRHLEDHPDDLPMVESLLTEIAMRDLPATLVVVSTTPVIPQSISRDSELLDFPLPDREQIIETIEATFAGFGYLIDPALRKSLADALAGMTQKEAEITLNTVLTTAAAQMRPVDDEDVRYVIDQKQALVRKSGVIDLVTSEVRFEDVGGLDNLKRWIKLRRPLFENPEEAARNGLRPPKGILLFGVPGSGKSLTSKMVANYYNLPLLSLSMGKIFGHASPAAAMTTALSLAEAIAPCVLWLDEVEKMFAGAGMSKNRKESGGGEIGRVFGILLTWMQENKKHVFLSVTSNDISNLEPTLYRDGRISERFFVGFIRSESELRSILDVHFRLRLKDRYEEIVKPLDYAAIYRQMRRMVERYKGSEYAGYSGANVEALVEKVLERRYFINKPHVETNDVIAVLGIVRPQHGTMIKEMQDRAREMDAITA